VPGMQGVGRRDLKSKLYRVLSSDLLDQKTKTSGLTTLHDLSRKRSLVEDRIYLLLISTRNRLS